ncbi:MAG: transketolase [Candidatus Riflebacteria bacterium]|nr:transketolase [Candidatus Riflebacteria bacterium]
MRNAFAREITALAAADPRLVLLSGDIGNRLFDEFKARHPDRFFNAGVAEANMTGMAAGMALSGLRPVTYTIATFNTYRCYEQIRLDLCYHRLPVIVVGVGAGLSYAGLGGTHQALEDIAMMRVLPHMTVLCPGDTVELRLLLRQALHLDGPVYLRLGMKNEPVVHPADPPLVIGRALPLREGEDVCLLSTGTTLPIAVAAADRLAAAGVAAGLASLPTVEPLDTGFLAAVADRVPLLATIEEHSVRGGLGSAVAEFLAGRPGPRPRVLRLGIESGFQHRVGSQAEARRRAGLTPEAVAERILAARAAPAPS